MAYQVDKFNGTFLTSVADGTIDSTTDLRFVGKNYAGYGEVQNENFLHLLESFANTTAPPKALTGQVWYDSANKKLKFYDGSKFKVSNGAEVAATAPSGLAVGEFWWDSGAKQLYTYTGTDFILVGPAASPDLGTSSATAQVVKDTLNTSHTILKFIAGGSTAKTIAIVSQDEFELNTSVNPITGFSIIKKGITLINTAITGVGTGEDVFWGSASNALKLNGVDASQYVQKGENSFTGGVSFDDSGFYVGNSSDIRLWIDPISGAIIENKIGEPITFRISNTFTSDTADILTISSEAITPGNTNLYDIGSSGNVWRNIYATTVNAAVTGELTGNSNGLHTGSVAANDSQVLVDATTKAIGFAGGSLFGTLFGSVQGNVTGTADNASKLADNSPSILLPSTADKTSVVVRSTDGDITARNFLGTATNSNNLLVGSTYRATSTAADANTIAARTSSGDIYAALFQGTATAARYADLAEKYIADKDYAPGTVVSVCYHEEHEVEACKSGDRALGVVSTNPAFMMNKDLEGGTYIALKGRVPCKVIGVVKKGQRLVAAANGCAVAVSASSNDVFAIALESSDNAEEKIIEAVVL